MDLSYLEQLSFIEAKSSTGITLLPVCIGRLSIVERVQAVEVPLS